MDAQAESMLRLVGEKTDYQHYLTRDELFKIGFDHVGDKTRISRKCSFYSVSGYIGDGVRIDDFSILKGHIHLDDYVHLAAYGMISAARGKVTIGAFTGIAARATILTGSDDYSADTLCGACVPGEYATTIKGPVFIGLGSLIGAHCVILPNVFIGEGASIGSGCVVWKNVPNGGIVRRGVPDVLTKNRRDHNRIKELAVRFYENRDGSSC